MSKNVNNDVSKDPPYISGASIIKFSTTSGDLPKTAEMCTSNFRRLPQFQAKILGYVWLP